MELLKLGHLLGVFLFFSEVKGLVVIGNAGSASNRGKGKDQESKYQMMP